MDQGRKQIVKGRKKKEGEGELKREVSGDGRCYEEATYTVSDPAHRYIITTAISQLFR